LLFDNIISNYSVSELSLMKESTMLQVNIQEPTASLQKLVEIVVKGEEVIIAKGNVPVAKLVPFNGNKVQRKLGTAKGKIKIADDFDAPLDDFKEYMG
jgi:antitoxin (DNA-binding transcriptional repressor) of toxin-antitoxin stability system